MFHLSMMLPYTEVPGVLRLTRDPFYYGTGVYTDVDGVRWDIHAVVGARDLKGSFVCARRLSDAPEYYSTATWADTSGSHEWLPYFVEVEDNDK